MSEPRPQSSSEGKALPEMSSVARTPIDYHRTAKRFHNLPEENEAIALNLEATLEQMGINKDDVVISGYHQRDEKRIVAHDAAHRQGLEDYIHDVLADIEMVRKSNWPEKDDLIAVKEKLIKEVQKLLDRPDATEYYFAPVESIRRDGTRQNNPVAFAGTTGGIGVYSRERLYEIDPELSINALDDWRVVATPDELATAQLLLFRPRYVPEDKMVDDHQA